MTRSVTKKGTDIFLWFLQWLNLIVLIKAGLPELEL